MFNKIKEWFYPTKRLSASIHITSQLIYISIVIMLIPSVFISEEMINNNTNLLSFSNFYPEFFQGINNIAQVASSVNLENKARLLFVLSFYLGFICFIIAIFIVSRMYLCQYHILKNCSKVYISERVKSYGTNGSFYKVLGFGILLLVGYDMMYFSNIIVIDMNMRRVGMNYQSEIGLYFNSILAIGSAIFIAYVIPEFLAHIYQFYLKKLHPRE